jgi:hypothetical protein
MLQAALSVPTRPFLQLCWHACLLASISINNRTCSPCPFSPAVPLKMIANFKRVKGLTKELSVVTEALKGSSMLSVDEEGSRVRRTTPLPAYDTSDICRRTVVAEHLPDKPTIGELLPLFVAKIRWFGPVQLPAIAAAFLML